MPVFDTFTKRKRRQERTDQPEVYRYDDVPKALRVQVSYILRETLGNYHEAGLWSYDSPNRANERWQVMRDVLARERGVFTLSKGLTYLTHPERGMIGAP